MHTPAQSLDCEQVALAYWHLCPGLKDYSANPHCRVLSANCTLYCMSTSLNVARRSARARAPNKAASWSLVFSETIPLSQCAPFRCHNQLVNKSPPFIDFWETHTLLGPPPSFSMRSQGQHPWSTMVGCSGGNAACLVLQSVWHGIDCHVVLMLHSISCPHIHTQYNLSWGQ